MPYTMPYGGWENPSYQQPVSHSPYTPMEQVGEDYLGTGYFAYPTSQYIPMQSQPAQSHSNQSSPTLFAPQPHAWSMLPISSNNAYSTGSMSSRSSPALQRQSEAWATMSTASYTPGFERGQFDFDNVSQPMTGAGIGLQNFGSYACIDTSNIHPAPFMQSSFASHDTHGPTFGGSSFPQLQSQSSFPYLSNQLQQSRSQSPAHPPSASPRSSHKSTTTSSNTKNTCPYPDCGKSYKDLAAHLLTHSSKRPYPCPIPSCTYHDTGFSRKYDRDRHVVTTHHKSTIICGFCPGSGSQTQKSFQRTDVFKRHLLSMHCQEGSTKSKKSSTSSTTQPSMVSAAGICSTCRNVFPSAQALLSHLDECVLRVVQQPSAVSENNVRLLSSMAENSSSYGADSENLSLEGSSDNSQDSHRINVNPRSGKGNIPTSSSSSSPSIRSNNNVISGRVSKRPTTTTTTLLAPQPLKRRAYPAAWALHTDEVNLKKRVTCVFDGQRRLFKDEMTVNTDYDLDVDLDLVSLTQANFLADASEEERMRWVGVPSY